MRASKLLICGLVTEIVGHPCFYEPNDQVGPWFSTEPVNGLHRLVLLRAIYLNDPSEYPDGTQVATEHVRSNEFRLEVT